jgi:uncharacterized protein involved in exopolysaccharide biosynthesis
VSELSDDSITPAKLIAVIRARWYVVLGLMLLAGIGTAAFAFSMIPIYRANTLLMPAQLTGQTGPLSSALNSLGGLGELVGISSPSSSENTTTEALALLQSRGFLEDFIQKNALMPKLFPDRWDAAANDWKPSSHAAPTIWRGYKRFSSDIMNASEDKKTRLVTLQIDWSDRIEGAKWANDLVDILNERLRQRAIAESTETIKFLEEETKDSQPVEVRNAISAMIESQLKTRALASVRKQYAFEILDPAVPSDQDVVVRPHRGLYILSALIVGFIIGSLAALMLGERGKGRAGMA